MATMAAEAIAPPTLRPSAGADGWTVDDLDTFPDDGLRYEIIDGILLVSPTPALGHQRALAELFSLLRAACPPHLEVFFAPLAWQPAPNRSFEPDLLVVRRDDATGTKLAGVPVFVIEVLSPSTARIDRTLKSSAYAETGAQQYWLVDPGTAKSPPTVEVYDLVDGQYMLQGKAHGSETLDVTGVIPVRVTPSSLIRQP